MNKKIDFKINTFNYCTIAYMSSSYRNVKDVIPRLLEVIPEDQTVLREKIIEFNDTTIKTTAPRHRDMWNQAPELMNSIYFKELGYILQENAGEIDTAWKINLIKVFANQE
jgi:hypothetical protein